MLLFLFFLCDGLSCTTPYLHDLVFWPGCRPSVVLPHVQLVLRSLPLTAGKGGDLAMSRRRPNFSTRTAQEDVERLDPNEQTDSAPGTGSGLLNWLPSVWSRHQDSASTQPTRAQRHSAPAKALGGLSKLWHRKGSGEAEQEQNGGGISSGVALSPGPLRDSSADKKDRHGRRRSVEEPKKLGTFSGVFVPTSLNVLSILMFLRFGFILGQAGLLGTLG